MSQILSKWRRFLVPFAAVILLLPSRLCGAAFVDRVEQQYEGTLGQSRIGMTIIREGNAIEGGHYFYQRFLKDIQITGAMDHDSHITLREPEGGVFYLQFTGNGSNGADPLNFENSTGLEGTWVSADGLRSYALSLRETTSGNETAVGRRYDSVTSDDDAIFESRVQSLYRAVLKDDRTAALTFISYPLRANFANGKHKSFETPVEVSGAWDQLFTAAMMAAWKRALPHDMFVRNGMVMIGDGEAWFGAKGLAVLNIPASVEKSGADIERDFHWDWKNSQELGPADRIDKSKELSPAERILLTQAIRDQGQKQNVLETRVKEIDINGDGHPEVIAQSSSDENCSPTGNCAFWIFERSTKGYVSILSAEAQTFTLQPSKTHGFSDIITGRHASATESELTVFKFDGTEYRDFGCFDANWSALGADGEYRELKRPHISRCGMK
jgi:hypothetical protein